MSTKVSPGGLFNTSTIRSVAPLMSAAFCSGVTPSRVIWMVTIGIFVSSNELPVTGVRAAVDVKSFAGDERGRLQIQHRIDDFSDLAHPPHGVQPGEEGVRFGLVHRRLDDPRRDRVHTDALVCVLDRQR